MGGRDDELGLSLSLGFGVTTTQPNHMQRPSSSMHNHHHHHHHLRKSSWNELFQFPGNLLDFFCFHLHFV